MACIYTYKGKQYSESEIKDVVFKNEVDASKIKFTTINDLANLLAYSNSKIILPGSKVEYQTPDGVKHSTYQEASNHISKLFNESKDVDLSGVKIDLKPIEDVSKIKVEFFKGEMSNDVDTTFIKDKDNTTWWKKTEKVTYEDGEPVFGEPITTKATNKELIEYYNKQSIQLEYHSIRNFIEKNKPYEQAKEIIETWKKENNIVYNPEEVYSRGQGFYSSIGAYSTIELDLLLQNLLTHIEDNKKAGFKPKVVLPIGTSGSGKSTWIKTLDKNKYTVISPDNMRVEFTGDMNNKSKDKEIYEAVKERTIQAINKGKQVVIDTTNLQKDRRRDFLNSIKSAIPNVSLEYKLMELNSELAKQRIKEDIAKGVDRANVPDSTIDRHTALYKEMLEDIKQEPLTEFNDNNDNYGFTISAFTKPIDKRINHLEKESSVRFVIYPKSEDIKWAAPTDVYSGSVWDAHEKTSKDKKSELLGVSFTKAPSLNNVNQVSPNLADIIDSLSHHHNELALELTLDNFVLEYDEGVSYEVKKLADNVNKILEQKRGGKIVKPEINKITIIPNTFEYWQQDMNEDGGMDRFRIQVFKKEDKWFVESFDTYGQSENIREVDYNHVKLEFNEALASNSTLTRQQGVTPTKNKSNVSSIESVKTKIVYQENFANQPTFIIGDTTYRKTGLGFDKTYYDEMYKNGEDRTVNISKEEYEKAEQKYKKDNNIKDEYTSQALTNLKIAALKEVAKKYPRSLITSKVVAVNSGNERQYSNLTNTINNSSKEKVDVPLSLTKQEKDDLNNIGFKRQCK